MFEKVEKCPVCNHSVFSNYIICKDYLVSGESFAITKCDYCGFLFTNPRPDTNNLEKYYQSEEYISHSNTSNNLTNILYKKIRVYTTKQKVGLINKLGTPHSILDIGCGTGNFLYACQKNHWQTFGIEPSKIARLQSEKLLNTTIYKSLDDFKNADKLGVVSLWHVLEHVANLNDTLDFIKNILDKKGKIVIAVPNHESLDAFIYQEFWAAYDLPRHLYHFSKKDMKLLLTKHGFKIKEILPMKLDAFYVSMLSEKYKYGKTNYFRAFKNGLLSNRFAKKHQDNYSSLIYIAGK